VTSTAKQTRITTPADEQIRITREFDAPRHLVWRAWTEAELVRRWWSGRRGAMTVCEVDLRVGGAYRFVLIATGGFEVAFHGEYREIVPEERLVYTEVFEGAPQTGEPAVNTATFTERDGRTTLELLTVVESREVRDMILASGMEVGVQEQMELLEDLARELA
jgi:uncharacterized protein YndB with AHSA1/START domain